MEVNYLVAWPRETLDELAQAWLDSTDRNAVTEASFNMEQELTTDPYSCGFPRLSPTDRTAVRLPLGFEFEIIEDDKLVRVLRVWAML
jgi:hypothetical protein